MDQEQPGLFADDRLPGETQIRLNLQARKILMAFQKAPGGKLTNLQLTQIAQRFGGRLHELRQAGWDIVTEGQDRVTGATTYRLKGRKNPAEPAPPREKKEHHGRDGVREDRLNRALKVAWADLEQLGRTATLTTIKDIMNGRV